MPKAENEAFTNTLTSLRFFPKFIPGIKKDYLLGANFSQNPKPSLTKAKPWFKPLSHLKLKSVIVHHYQKFLSGLEEE